MQGYLYYTIREVFMLKRTLFLLLIAACFAAPLAAADIGAGIIVGEPTGLSFSLDNQLILGAAWSFRNYVHIHGDYLFIRQGLPELEEEFSKPFGWYLGAGAKLRVFTRDKDKDDSEIGLGVRVPVGITFYPLPELELFLELVPGIALFPDTEGDLDAGIGIRYHFASGE
jgi:uncharacterized protein DUF3996